MNLSEWLNPWIAELPLDFELNTAIQDDTRNLKANDIFFALPTSSISQAELFSRALEKKPKAIIFSKGNQTEKAFYQEGILWIPIENLKNVYASIIQKYFDYPQKKLSLFGITGTNGKTSCSHFLSQMLDALGVSSGVIGTLGYGKCNQLQFFGMTTPSVLALQKILSSCVNQKMQAISMEVSSHAIHQNRIDGLLFEAGLFTNLTRDHLDYHGSMENYAHEKKRFLISSETKKMILNADDEYGLQWILEFQKTVNKPIFAYSLKELNGLPQEIPCTQARILKRDVCGTQIQIHSPFGNGICTIPLLGDFNISNALGVFTMLCAQGFEFMRVLDALSHLRSVPGRMETIISPTQNQPWVLVDFAHTPDALEKVLLALRPYVKSRLICIFGCGGNRDQGKRPIMANIAGAYSDEVMVTSDNPRFENPKDIIQEIMAGFLSGHSSAISQCIDRKSAIQKVLSKATPLDLILIAGKGDEQYQEIHGEKIPYSDKEVVLSYFGHQNEN